MRIFLVLVVLLLALPLLANGSATLGDACQAASECVSGLRCKGGVCAAPLISYTTYKTVHVFSALTVFLALGGLIFLSISGSEDKRTRKIASILHGVFMLLILVGGFGLMARLNFDHGAGWPLWIKLKMGLWVLIGGFIMVPRRLPTWNRRLWPLALALGGAAAYMAIHKPV